MIKFFENKKEEDYFYEKSKNFIKKEKKISITFYKRDI